MTKFGNPQFATEHEGRFVPVIYPEEEPFWKAAREHRLVLQSCDRCHQVWFPIGPNCPRCLSDGFTWQEMSGQGKVSSFVVFHKPWADWLRELVPYVVAQVELDEGPRLTSNLPGVALDDVQIGLPVRVVFEDVSPDITLPQFTVSGQ
jgi:uncharacterized protein